MTTASLISTTDSHLYLTVGALCLVMLSVAWWRRCRERRVTIREVTRGQTAHLREERELRQAMEALLAQLEDVSRRINAQTDTRIAKLEALLREADARTGGPPDSTSSRDVALKTASVAASRVAPAPERRPQRFARVYELADSGTAPLAIADTLQVPVGEVELILNLRKFGA